MSKKYDNDLNKIKYVVPTYATNGFDIDKENNIYKITTTFIAQFYDAKEKYLIDGLLKDIQENKERYKGLTIIPVEREKIVELLNKGNDYEKLQQQLAEKDKEIEELKKDLKSQKGLTDLYSTIAGTNATKMSIEKATRHQICEKIRQFVELNEDWGTIFVCQIYEFLKEIEKGE